MSRAYSEEELKNTSLPRDVETGELQQDESMFEWDKLQKCGICCCNFVLQMVLSGSLGSFLFGFNLSLLNTSLPSIASEYGWCGPSSTLFLGTDPATYCLDSAGGLTPECLAAGCKLGTVVKCPGGPNDIGCNRAKWYNSFMSVAVFVGAAIGSMTSGGFIKMGRRLLLLVTMAIFTFGIVSSCVANSFSALLWARLVVGYGVGIVSCVAPTYMSEVTPINKRGAYGVFHQLFITVGIFVAVLIGLPLTNPGDQDDFWVQGTFDKIWWRVMLGLGIIPVIIAAYMFGFVFNFETPHYYCEQRRYKDAQQVLQRLYGVQDVSSYLNEIVDEQRKGEEMKRNGVNLWSSLGNPVYRKVVLFGILLSAFQQFGGINVFIASSNALFQKAGLNGTMQTVMSTIMTFLNVLMTFPTIYLIEKLGRKTLLLGGAVGQFLFVVPACISYWTEKDVENPGKITQILAIVGVIGFVCCFAVAYGPVLWVYLFEVFPMEIKDSAAGAATAANWVAGIVMVFLSSQFNNAVSYTLFAGLQLVAVIIIVTLMKETKGRALGDSPYITRK